MRSWNLALTQLQKHAPLDIDEDIRKAFTHLKLSYDYLKSEEAKSCFLLCSLFPEDIRISLERLVLYGVGLGKFDNLDSMEDARNRVQTSVNFLKSSGLLLNDDDDDDEDFTKMHDVVRDMALLIASEGKNKFLVKAGKGLTEWLPIENDVESYTGISLMNNDIIKLPDYEVHLSRLNIFIINKNYELPMISNEFIGCMKEVKVLDMGWCRKSSLPQSLKLLTKLRMLNLERNESFHEISILGEMKDLEIVILNETGIKEIPQEIAELVNLRRLEINDCDNLCHITPGVISRLRRLEELCIDFQRMPNGVYDRIVEVMGLPKLTYLEIRVPSVYSIPHQGFNSVKLKGLVIQIGKYYQSFTATKSDRYLILSTEHLRIPLFKWIKELVEVSRPIIILYGIENLNNIQPTLYDESFNKLEHIQLSSCDNVSCLVDGTSCDWDQRKTNEKYLMELKHLTLSRLYKLEVLWKCPDEYTSFTNLVNLFIDGCNKLLRVFTMRSAQGLVNLKELRIEFCDGLEEVIWGGGDDHEEIDRGIGETEILDQSANVIVFPCLATLWFGMLPGLKCFYLGNCTIKYPSLVDVHVYGCDCMEIWAPGISDTPNLKSVNGDVLILNGPSAINDSVAKSIDTQKRRNVVMANCDGSLSSSDFQIAANVFSEKWKMFNYGFSDWVWIDCSNRLLGGFSARGVSDGYLSLQNVLLKRSLKEERDEGSSDDVEEPFDNATLNTADDDGHRYDFHVVYSASYRVPVLYFRAYSSDGQPLNLDEIEKNLPTKSAEVLAESKWTFITQEEHPYLNRPWYTLHPCGTSEWMKLLLAGDNSTTEGGIERYLVSWISVVGQVFGLKLPFDMLKSIN